MTRRTVTRRTFLQSTAGAGAGALLLPLPGRVSGANDRVAVAVAGLGRRGRAHVAAWASLPDVDVVALCDTQGPARDRCAGQLLDVGRPRPRRVSDLRWLLDDPAIDAISIALPDDLQASLALAVCDAGKDVMVAPPAALTRSQGDALKQASVRSGRLVSCLGRPFWSAGTLDSAVRDSLLGAPTDARLICLFSGRRRLPDERPLWWTAGLLDLLRRDRGLGSPAPFSDASLSSGSGSFRCRLHFEDEDRPLRIELEARKVPSSTLRGRSDPMMQVTMQGRGQQWTLSGVLESVIDSPWRRFVDAVRSRDGARLSWPLDEALRAVSWVRAARDGVSASAELV